PSQYESDVQAWIYDSLGQESAHVTIHLACTSKPPSRNPELDLTADRVYTLDGNGAPSTTFHCGDPIRFVVDLTNHGTTGGMTVRAVYRAYLDVYPRPPAIFQSTHDQGIGPGPGTASIQAQTTMPSGASSGTYRI